jgi:hypothetical protein
MPAREDHKGKIDGIEIASSLEWILFWFIMFVIVVLLVTLWEFTRSVLTLSDPALPCYIYTFTFVW